MSLKTKISNNKFVFIGLDGEMSGIEPTQGARLIQAGVSYTLESAYITKEFTLNPGEHTWSLEAELVHKISPEVINKGPSSTEVDSILSLELNNLLSAHQAELLIPIGFNVGSFDLPFFKMSLPKTASLLSHRVVDLNSLIFFVSENIPVKDFETLKNNLKTEAKEKIDVLYPNSGAHSAGYDSLEALLIFDNLKNYLKI